MAHLSSCKCRSMQTMKHDAMFLSFGFFLHAVAHNPRTQTVEGNYFTALAHQNGDSRQNWQRNAPRKFNAQNIALRNQQLFQVQREVFFAILTFAGIWRCESQESQNATKPNMKCHEAHKHARNAEGNASPRHVRICADIWSLLPSGSR